MGKPKNGYGALATRFNKPHKHHLQCVLIAKLVRTSTGLHTDACTYTDQECKQQIFLFFRCGQIGLNLRCGKIVFLCTVKFEITEEGACRHSPTQGHSPVLFWCVFASITYGNHSMQFSNPHN